jgi:SAM-dependent methyltransferase
MYILDNAATEAATRLSALAEMYDPGTFRHLQSCGIGEGWHCLEIGAGNGSVVRWLADRVGPTGHVLATDLDPRHLESSRRSNVEIRQHNIATDPLPTEAFDLIHARLVLNVIPPGAQVLSRLIRALKPGGWLVSEDFEYYVGHSESDEHSVHAPLKSTEALRQVLSAAGLNTFYGRGSAARFRAAGLSDVDAAGRVFIWRGGTAGAALTRANREQLRRPILETGLITENELEKDLANLGNPDFETTSPILWAAWGRKPGGSIFSRGAAGD